MREEFRWIWVLAIVSRFKSGVSALRGEMAIEKERITATKARKKQVQVQLYRDATSKLPLELKASLRVE